MSIKHGLLALLGERPRHGYQLKTAFEARTGGTWPLNVGQVYTTLQRLERDGLVSAADAGEDGTVTYALTDAGRDEVTSWWSSTVERHPPPRDELAIKVALALGSSGADVGEVVRAQRVRTVRTLQWLTRLRADADSSRASNGGGDGGGSGAEGGGPYPDRATALILDRLIFEADAEARWLDHVERTHLGAESGRTGRHDLSQDLTSDLTSDLTTTTTGGTDS